MTTGLVAQLTQAALSTFYDFYVEYSLVIDHRYKWNTSSSSYLTCRKTTQT